MAVDAGELNLYAWRPPREEVFVSLTLRVGDPATDSGDLFYVQLATPEGLRSHGRGALISSRALLVVSDFEWSEIESHLRSIVGSCAAEDWPETVQRLQRFFAWEYEGMA